MRISSVADFQPTLDKYLIGSHAVQVVEGHTANVGGCGKQLCLGAPGVRPVAHFVTRDVSIAGLGRGRFPDHQDRLEYYRNYNIS